ncbi:MAG: glutamate--tRNA ligase family protein [Saprospiraceae bacterium]|nr:tRNA glutamyl-Q synthetase [Lewinellaceae bacterium]
MPFSTAYRQFIHTIRPNSRLRLAPTPSGFLHLGNARNFILTWLAARYQPGARLLLRIDDLDADRKRPEYVQDIFDTLAWLGLDWDEGPRAADDFEKNWSQQLRMPLYFSLLEELRDRDLLFACAKSRRELAPFEGNYPIEFRDQGIALDSPDVAWRIKTPRAETEIPQDFVVKRRDGVPAYQVASLADDLYFGITDIIRGEDLAASTAAQQFLAKCLGREQFTAINFLHHPLLLDQTGAKLSKSAGAAAIKTHRRDSTPAQIYQELARWLGVPANGVHSADDLLAVLHETA